jgi:hypothetical protein
MWLAQVTIGQSFAVRVAISVTTLTVAGAMMGMPFPIGMARFDDRDRSWYWAINGATSVLASVLALVIALIAGFAVVLGCAVASYLVAALTLPDRAVAAGLDGPRERLLPPTAAASKPKAA